MKKVGLTILIIVTFAVFAFAQTKSLPPNLAKWNGAQSDIILQNSVIKVRLKKLLGTKNYAEFMESFETINPIVKKQNFLFTSGCLIHACGHVESAIAIDIVNKTIHVGIFRETEKTKFFNERGRKTPSSIKNWANRLSANK